ncbi:MAG: multicopper oxidase, type 3 [Thermoleophilia bacterium]|nr:multicopper oxidase, type 3 [Thermoleophilia bacterium]
MHLVTAIAATTTVLALSAAALVLLLTGTSSARDGDSTLQARGHGGHGAVAGTISATAAEMAEMDHGAAMIGEGVAAPGEPDATDYLLDLPGPKPYQPGRVREFTLVTEEHDLEVAEGLTFPAWTFTQPGHDAAVPGPVLRVTEGDTVRITLRNASSQPHSLHTHGIHPSSQDGVLDMVGPGESFTYEFTAGPSGVQPYHCHAMPLKKHISKGMYGTMIIDPKVPPKEVADREMAMVMNAYDTNYDGENEVYTVNGLAFHYAKYPIKVKRGELNRIYLVNMTENDPLNSFHVHGNFFDYRPIGFDNPSQYTDIVSQIQGDRGIIDIRFPEAGPFMFHAHQTEFGDLGWMGFFEVVE